jgi:hypothetical protein
MWRLVLEVMCSGNIVALGVAPTTVRAHADALKAAASQVRFGAAAG